MTVYQYAERLAFATILKVTNVCKTKRNTFDNV